ADLDEGARTGFQVGIDDMVDDFPVVDWFAGRVFGVGVGRSPLQARRAVAGSEQEVRANIDRLAREVGQLADKRFAILHVRVVRLVITEVAEEGARGSGGAGSVDPNMDGLSESERGKEQCDGRVTAAPSRSRRRGKVHGFSCLRNGSAGMSNSARGS